MWVDDDKRILAFQGVVRPDDIDSGNTVLSEKVSDVRLVFKGAGPAHKATTRGLFSRIIQAIVDLLWPF
jgi:flagellar basal body L-ring protein FlgH